jgi:hypothetical protein
VIDVSVLRLLLLCITGWRDLTTVVTPDTLLRWHRQPMGQSVIEWNAARVQRRDRLGGVIHEYSTAA